MSAFAHRLIVWQRRHGRHGLPWQGTRDPYLVWLSEIMLQQTQVATVIPYFQRFRARFPDVTSLAAADEEQVLQLWSGLGYYSRARNLHRAAQAIVSAHGGAFPTAREAIESLPGIGRSTAAAIAALAFGAREAILDGNAKRVLARHFAVAGRPGVPAVDRELWRLADSLLPTRDVARYTQALMDLGATLCTLRSPSCPRCPVGDTCGALALQRVADFPAPRPTRTLPHRSTHMFVLVNGTDVLLEKRPAPGIWGGLWSFPEAPSHADLAGLAKRHSLLVLSEEELATVAHGFTHFTLDIQPIVVRVQAKFVTAAEPGALWVPFEAADSVALPAPVKRIMAALARSARGEPALFQEPLQDL